jgi:membrane-bound lytic murein transglycosylase D
VAPVAVPAAHTLLYTVRRGDTLVSISDRFGVSLAQLRRWNSIPAGIKVEAGRRLHVAEPATVRRVKGRRYRTTITADDLKVHTSSASKKLARGSSKATKADGSGDAKTSAHRPAAAAGAGKSHSSSSTSARNAHGKALAKKQK